MIPLPDGRVEDFERWLWRRWADRSWYVRRGSLGCSFGLLGLRWAEVAVMQPGDLFVDAGRLYVRTRKRGRPRTIDAPVGLLRAAVELRAQVKGGENRVFTTRSGRGMVYADNRRFVKVATMEVFGQPFSFHCFRHTAAVRLYERTRDVLAVQRHLGHKSLQWTNTYLQTLMVVDVGGPVAFCGGGKGVSPRLYDPDGNGEEGAAKAAAVGRVDAAGAGGGASAASRSGRNRTRRAIACDRPAGKAASGGDREVFEADRQAGARVDEFGDRVGKSTSLRGVHLCEANLMPVKIFRDRGMRYAKCRLCGALFASRVGESIEMAVKVEEGPKRMTSAEALEATRCDHDWIVRDDGRGEIVLCKECGKVYGRTPAKAVEAREKKKARRESGGQGRLF